MLWRSHCSQRSKACHPLNRVSQPLHPRILLNQFTGIPAVQSDLGGDGAAEDLLVDMAAWPGRRVSTFMPMTRR